ncbi:MAG: hypothetical protein ACOCP4_01480 [Candidatus Woesearchaeota archaeon]
MKLNLFFDLTNSDTNKRIISNEILYKVFEDSGLLDEFLFSTRVQVFDLSINEILMLYAQAKNISGLANFLENNKLVVEYCNTNLNIIVIAVLKKK